MTALLAVRTSTRLPPGDVDLALVLRTTELVGRLMLVPPKTLPKRPRRLSKLLLLRRREVNIHEHPG